MCVSVYVVSMEGIIKHKIANMRFDLDICYHFKSIDNLCLVSHVIFVDMCDISVGNRKIFNVERIVIVGCMIESCQ